MVSGHAIQKQLNLLAQNYSKPDDFKENFWESHLNDKVFMEKAGEELFDLISCDLKYGSICATSSEDIFLELLNRIDYPITVEIAGHGGGGTLACGSSNSAMMGEGIKKWLEKVLPENVMSKGNIFHVVLNSCSTGILSHRAGDEFHGYHFKEELKKVAVGFYSNATGSTQLPLRTIQDKTAAAGIFFKHLAKYNVIFSFFPNISQPMKQQGGGNIGQPRSQNLDSDNTPFGENKWPNQFGSLGAIERRGEDDSSLPYMGNVKRIYIMPLDSLNGNQSEEKYSKIAQYIKQINTPLVLFDGSGYALSSTLTNKGRVYKTNILP